MWVPTLVAATTRDLYTILHCYQLYVIFVVVMKYWKKISFNGKLGQYPKLELVSQVR
jgi:hypothetical protein